MQIAYRAFAIIQRRQLYIAKVDSIEKLFYNTKMASLRRPEIGRQAQRIGRNAERRVITELEEAGWGTESNAELDYAGKQTQEQLAQQEEKFLCRCQQSKNLQGRKDV